MTQHYMIKIKLCFIHQNIQAVLDQIISCHKQQQFTQILSFHLQSYTEFQNITL